MPYVSPSQQTSSPAPSSPSSAQNHRTAFLVESPPRSPGPNNHLPRSSSQSYFHKPRRSPSHLTHGESSPRYDRSDSSDRHALHINTNIRQSPPPQSNAVIPPGAMISPPESAHNSSDDEDSSSAPQVDNSKEIAELQDAVHRHIKVTRNGSPPGSEDDLTSLTNSETIARSKSESHLAIPPALSSSARKISHSRSSSENVLHSPLTHSQAASDEEEDDEDMPSKPPLVRKKSGELVKPAIRPKSRKKPLSVPGTPTYAKAVHFNDDIAQVRHFLHADRPIAVSAGTSPVEAYDDHEEYPFSAGKGAEDFEMKLTNFPRQTHERQTQLIRLDSLTLSHDQKSLVGVAAVANIAFTKHVAARFTFDYWKTTSEVVADYSNDARHASKSDGYDPFVFSIKLADQSNVGNKTLLLCMRYNVNGEEHWDNNSNSNFQVDFAKRPRSATTAGPAAGGPPRSRRGSGRSHRPQSLPSSLDDDFSIERDRGIQFRSGMQSKPPIFTASPPAKRPVATGQQFGNRYDFGASLTAALTQAQAALGDRSGIKPRSGQGESSAPGPKPAQQATRAVIQPSANGTDSPRADSLLTNKQSIDSRAYQEFVSKFCFFGSKPSPPVQVSKGSENNDGANDQDFFGAGPGPEVTNDNNERDDNGARGFPGLVLPERSINSVGPQTASNQSSGSAYNESSENGGFAYKNRENYWTGSATPPAILG